MAVPALPLRRPRVLFFFLLLSFYDLGQPRRYRYAGSTKQGSLPAYYAIPLIRELFDEMTGHRGLAEERKPARGHGGEGSRSMWWGCS